MHEPTELMLAPPALASPRARYLQRMAESRLRLEQAVATVKERAHELTPAGRIQADPVAWIVGGALLGFAFGLLTGGGRR